LLVSPGMELPGDGAFTCLVHYYFPGVEAVASTGDAER
jgi:hypothetical protein